MRLLSTLLLLLLLLLRCLSALGLFLCGALLCFAFSLFALGLFLRLVGSMALGIHASLASFWCLLRLCRLRCLWCSVGSCTTCEFGHGRILLHVINGDPGAE